MCFTVTRMFWLNWRSASISTSQSFMPWYTMLTAFVSSAVLMVDTESPERLHIDYAKDAYRASNKRDYVEQMALWLQRQEAIELQTKYLSWHDQKAQKMSLQNAIGQTEVGSDSESDGEALIPIMTNMPRFTTARYHIAKQSPHPLTTVHKLETDYGATDFIPALTSFLKTTQEHCVIAPGHVDRFDVFKRIIINQPPNIFLSDEIHQDCIRATPSIPARGRKSAVPAHFDVAFIREDPKMMAPTDLRQGLQGTARSINLTTVYI
jgi:hypothetical protein